jgi:hypothetical protein
MKVDAVSPSTGAERVLDVSAAGTGILLVINEKGDEKARVVTPTDAIMDVLSERPTGPQALAGELVVEVRRNEVWLSVGGTDAAVGLDDLTDAVAASVTA